MSIFIFILNFNKIPNTVLGILLKFNIKMKIDIVSKGRQIKKMACGTVKHWEGEIAFYWASQIYFLFSFFGRQKQNFKT